MSARAVRRRAATRPPCCSRLRVTQLEDRAVPATLLLDDGGVLTYTGAASHTNNLTVSYDAVGDRYTFTETGSDPRITPSGFVPDWGSLIRTVRFAADRVSAIVINLGDLDDTLQVLGLNDPLALNGGPGTDRLSGPAGTNVWRVAGPNSGGLNGSALAGPVTFAGTERLHGGVAADRFVMAVGGTLSSRIEGGGGADALDYSPWVSRVSVSLAAGTATAAAGGIVSIERVTGGSGSDSLIGGLGADSLVGGPGNDTVNGGPGNDSLSGGTGNDWLDGGTGHDRLWGDAGTDRLYGYTGNDSINGGPGNDFLHGEAGHDRLGAYPSGFDWVDDAGDDVMYGADGNDSLAGGFGTDQLRGGIDPDLIHGDVGDDSLFGDGGDDSLYGDSDRDQLFGGPGGDIMRGGEGDDSLVGIDHATADALFGDGGLDTFWVDENTVPVTFADGMPELSPEETRTTVHRVRRFENGADRTLDGDAITDPADGVGYRNFRDLPLFASTGPSADDVKQGAVGDCWLLASMSAIARTDPDAIRQIVADLGDGTYVVRLGGNRYYRVDADLPAVDGTSNDLVFADPGRENSLWAPLVEKAYAHFRTGANTYASLNSGWEVDALRGLGATGVDSGRWSGLIFADAMRDSLRAFLDRIEPDLDTGLAVTVGFNSVATGCPCVGNHAYTLMGVNRDAAGQVVSVTLRNPWGWDGIEHDDPRSDGNKFDARVTVTLDQLLFSESWISWGTVN